MVNVLTINNNNSHKITAAIICFPNCFVFMVFFFFEREDDEAKNKNDIIAADKIAESFSLFHNFLGVMLKCTCTVS